MLGLYISIPFCRSKCTYCNFASGVYPAGEHSRYVDRLIEDMAAAGEWAARMSVELPRRVDTVYLGGGTPSLLEPDLLMRLFAAMRAEFDFEPDAEIAVECAPGQLADETLAALAAAGVNRVSLGVQSFIDREAAVSGRLHNRAAVMRDLGRLRQAGIANLSVDLIAGLAGQTFASWRESLAALLECGVPHASVYMLEIDEDSRLGREMLAGGARYHAGQVPPEDAIARMYSAAIESLTEAGLRQYEISNFARPGFVSRHNLRYWQRRPYLGLGLDASSMLRERAGPAKAAEELESDCGKCQGTTSQTAEKLASDGQECQGTTSVVPKVAAKSTRALAPEVCFSGVSRANGGFILAGREGRVLRSTTTSDLEAYLAGQGEMETEWLPPARQREEAWFLGLRLNAGVDVAEVEREFGRERVAPALEAAARLAKDGLLAWDGGTVRLTSQGRLLSNEVFQEFLDLEAEFSLETSGD